MIDLILVWLSAAIIVDAALLAGAETALLIQYFYPKKWPLPDRTGFERGALAGSVTLMLILIVVALLWDMWHDNGLPYAQFPLAWRLALTLPALALLNWSLVGRAIRMYRVRNRFLGRSS